MKKICSPENCKFYYTKPDSTPLEFFGLFQAAMLLREARLCELKEELAYYELTFPFWAIESYKAAERAFRKVESEEAHKDPKNSNNDMTITYTGNKVFADIERAAMAKRAKLDLPEFEAVEQEFEMNPELSDEISNFMLDQI